MGPLGIVVLLAGLNDGSRMGETTEPMQIQAFITELAVEALDVGVLRRLAGCDEIEGNAMRIRPGVQRLAGKLRPIVNGDPLGRAVPADELVKEAGHFARSGC